MSWPVSSGSNVQIANITNRRRMLWEMKLMQVCRLCRKTTRKCSCECRMPLAWVEKRNSGHLIAYVLIRHCFSYRGLFMSDRKGLYRSCSGTGNNQIGQISRGENSSGSDRTAVPGRYSEVS